MDYSLTERNYSSNTFKLQDKIMELQRKNRRYKKLIQHIFVVFKIFSEKTLEINY
jgi:hypothetical protein